MSNLSDELEWKINCLAESRHKKNPYSSYKYYKEAVTEEFASWLVEKFMKETEHE